MGTATAAPRHQLGVNLYTTGQVAALLRCAPRTAAKVIDSGALRGYRVPESGDRRVRRADLVRYARDRGIPLSLDAVAVACLVVGPVVGHATVSAVVLGGMVSAGSVSAVLVGCAEGLPAAVAVAREVRTLDPGVRLTLILSPDRPASDVPPGLFDEVTRA